MLCCCCPTIWAPALSSPFVSARRVTSCLIVGGRAFRARWSASWLVMRVWSYRFRTPSIRSNRLTMPWTAFCSSAAHCCEAVHLISLLANVPSGRPDGVVLLERAIRVLAEEVQVTWEISSLSSSIGLTPPLPQVDCDIIVRVKVSDSYLSIKISNPQVLNDWWSLILGTILSPSCWLLYQQKYYLRLMRRCCVLTSATSLLCPVFPVPPESRCDLISVLSCQATTCCFETRLHPTSTSR